MLSAPKYSLAYQTSPAAAACRQLYPGNCFRGSASSRIAGDRAGALRAIHQEVLTGPELPGNRLQDVDVGASRDHVAGGGPRVGGNHWESRFRGQGPEDRRAGPRLDSETSHRPIHRLHVDVRQPSKRHTPVMEQPTCTFRTTSRRDGAGGAGWVRAGGQPRDRAPSDPLDLQLCSGFLRMRPPTTARRAAPMTTYSPPPTDPATRFDWPLAVVIRCWTFVKS